MFRRYLDSSCGTRVESLPGGRRVYSDGCTRTGVLRQAEAPPDGAAGTQRNLRRAAPHNGRAGRVRLYTHRGKGMRRMDAVTVSGLRKTYGKTVAVDGLDLSVRSGQVFGMLGPNTPEELSKVFSTNLYLTVIFDTFLPFSTSV